LEELYETLAYHFSKSRDRESAYKYLKLAGLKATRNYSLWEAFHFFREAIDVLNESPESPERNREQMELRLLMTSSMISLGFPEDSLQILQQGERIARAMQDERNLTTLCSVIGLYFSVKGDPIRGIKYGERCLRMAARLQDIDVMAPVAFDLASNYASRGQFLKVTKIAPSVLTRLEEAGKQHDCFDRGYNVYSAVAAFYGWSLAYTGNFEEARVFCEKAVAHASQPLNLYGLGLAELTFGFSYTNKGDGKHAIPHFENSIKCLEKGQIFVLLGLAWSGLGWSYHFMGDNETARTYIEKGLNIQEGAGISYDLSASYCFLSQVCYELGHREEALKYAEEAIHLSRKNHERFIEGESLLALGRIFGKLGNAHWEKAESHIRQGIKILADLKLKTYLSTGHLFLAELFAYQGQREEALRIGRKAIAMLQECGMDYFIEKARPLINALEAKK
jgi:tetratricopeptide (TPR) repeat protein